MGITAIFLDSEASNTLDDAGNLETAFGVFEWADGSTGRIAEYDLQTDASQTNPLQYLEVSPEIEALPDLMGHGNVLDLHQAMAQDSSGELQALVEQFIAEPTASGRETIFQQIIFKWAGVDHLSPDAYGEHIDARVAQAVDNFFGGTLGNPFLNPASPQENLGYSWKNTYTEIFEGYYGALMSQTHLKEIRDTIDYVWDADEQQFRVETGAVIAKLEESIADNPDEGRQLLSEFARACRGAGWIPQNDYISLREHFIELDPDLGWVFDTGGLTILDVEHAWDDHLGTPESEAISASISWNDNVVHSRTGDDVIYGTDSDDRLVNEDGNDVIVAGGGDDLVWDYSTRWSSDYGTGNSIMDGGAGDDCLYGSLGNDTYIFRKGSGHDTVFDYDVTEGNTDNIWLGSNLTPDDIALSRVGNSMRLTILDTGESLTVKDCFRFPSSLAAWIEEIRFMDGTVWTYGDMLDLMYVATDGDDVIYGSDDDDELSGGQGNDRIYGVGGNDILNGDEGEDVLLGGSGDDILEGGLGNDTLYGGPGNDTYVFNLGDGQDTIFNQGATAIDEDMILFGPGIGPDDVRLELLLWDRYLKLTITGANDSIIIRDWLDYDLPQNGVKSVQFDDGTIWDLDTLQDRLMVTTDGDDNVAGFARADNIYGLAGNDTINGRGGSDLIYGDAGDDTLSGASGDDTIHGGLDNDDLFGGEGADTLLGEEGADSLEGGSGDDSLSGGDGRDDLQGGSGDDVLEGGAGNDTLYGGTNTRYSNWDDANGNDTYLFGRGDGIDTIVDHDTTAGNTDTIRFADDIAPEDVLVSRTTNDLKLSIDGTDDELIVRDWFRDGSAEYRVERVEFADGTVWDVDHILTAPLQGTPHRDQLLGNDQLDDPIYGLDGNDSLYGYGGADTLDGGSGSDWLDGGEGSDTLIGGEGTGSDTLVGGTGNDVLDGGAGNDYLYGGMYLSGETIEDWKQKYPWKSIESSGADTYLFGRGSGNDEILDYDEDPGNIDTIKLADGITADDITLSREWSGYYDRSSRQWRYDFNLDRALDDPQALSDDLTLTINDTGETIKVRNFFLGDLGSYQIERIEFSDGTIWDVDDMKLAALVGSSESDLIQGYSSDDTLQGGDGTDVLRGMAGDDILDGGPGTDYLFGGGLPTLEADPSGYGYIAVDPYGEGADTYLFGRGSGVDYVYDLDYTQGNVDAIVLASDISPDDVRIQRGGAWGNDLVLSIIGANDSIHMMNQFSDGESIFVRRIEEVRFADGTVWDVDTMDQMALKGTPDSDRLVGYSTADTINGFSGDDTLYGNGDDDTLDGGAGDDRLEGGAGNDTYLFGLGGGQDTILEDDSTEGNVDTVILGAGIAVEDVRLTRGEDSLFISILETDDRLELKDWFLDEAHKIERLQFSDGTVWDETIMTETAYLPSEGDDLILGTPEKDLIDGGGGNDRIYGRESNDTLYGGSGNDELYGEEGDDILYGGAGADTLSSGNGANTLNGGEGDDSIVATEGTNTIHINKGDGFDTISSRYIDPAFDGDTIVFGEGITPSDLSVQMTIGAAGSGLALVKDLDAEGIWPFEESGVALDGEFFFLGDGPDGTGLWRSDGTPSGTVFLENSNVGWGINGLTNVDGTLFFASDTGIWKSDGSNDGTALVKENLGYSIQNLTAVGGALYFTASDGTNGYELWTSDGTEAGTFMVADIQAGSGNSYPSNLVDANGTLFFTADDGVHGEELWISDGTAAGTVMVADIYAGSNDSYIDSLAGAGDSVFFSADDGVHGRQLWVSDGTEAGTVSLTDFDYGVSNLTESGGKLFFTADDGVHGEELWVSDGTEAGTMMVSDICDGSDSSYTDYMTDVDGKLFFYAYDGVHGSQLWVTDGTEAGTVRLTDLYDGGPDDLTNVGGMLFFSRWADNIQIWQSDGTEAGTVMVTEFTAEDDYEVHDLTGMTDVNGAPFFFTSDGGEGYTQLWKIDSSASGSGDVQLAIGFGDNEGVLIGAESTSGVTLEDLATKRFIFSDGTELTLDDILARVDGGVIGDQTGTEGDDTLKGSVTNDSIYALGGNDEIAARDRNDYVDGGAGDDAISLGSGNDTAYGGEGSDIIAGGHGDDTLFGAAGDDVFAFNRGDGHDYINPSDGSPEDRDTISFGVSINPQDVTGYIADQDLVLQIDGGDEIRTLYFDPEEGQILEGGVSRVQFIDANGDAVIYDLSGLVDALRADLAAATAENPLALFQDAGAFDITQSSATAGGDYAVAYAQTGDLFALPTYSQGTEGDDTMYGGVSDDTIDAGPGADTIDAGSGNDTIYAGLGDDNILAGDGNDIIDAGDGTDVIDAGAGDDEIMGLQGGDTAIGGSGDDTYYFNLGDGAVSIQDTAAPDEGNTIVFGEGITADMLTLIPALDSMTIQVGDEGDQINLSVFDPEDAQGVHAVDTFRFADATELTFADLTQLGFDLEGTEGDDVLQGTSEADRITGYGGDDILVGGAGDDLLDGGSGNDIYVFNLGDGIDTIRDVASSKAGNVVQFGPGVSSANLTLTTHDNMLLITVGSGDTLQLEGFDPSNPYNTVAVSVFRFADGVELSSADLLDIGFTFEGTPGDDTLAGTAARDLFIGNVGNDTLSGGLGDDTYVYNVGDGVDTITDESTLFDPNMLALGVGVNADDTTLTYDSTDLILNLGTDGSAIHLSGFDASDPYGAHAIEFFQFGDGQLLTYSELIDKGFDIEGGATDDTLTGTGATDRILGGAGDDSLSGAAGNDTLIGGDGDDTYYFNLGDGVDLIDDVATAAEGNTLVFGEGITLEDMERQITFQDDVLIIRVGENGDEVHLTGFDPDAAEVGPRAVQTFEFADGSIISYEQLVANTFIVQGGSADDHLTGTTMTDRLYGYEGSDRLEGGLGIDTLTGGVNNDELIGGEGSDAYVFSQGDGVDTIIDSAIPEEGNLIYFNEGVTLDTVSAYIDGSTLIVSYGTAGDEIHLLNFDYNMENGSHVVETLEFADGTEVALISLVDPGTEGDDNIIGSYFTDVINARGGNDTVTAFQDNDTIDGGTGDDSIDAGSGDDLITGGAGNDTLVGGEGYDTYFFNLGDGVDTITDVASLQEGNLISFGDGVTLDDISLTLDGTTLTIAYGTGGDAIQLLDFDYNAQNGSHVVETLGFADGTYVRLPSLIDPGTEGDDIIMGSYFVDVIDAKGGNDTVITFESNDIIYGGSGNDILDGGGANDSIYGGSGDDTITGGYGQDTLVGGEGNDTYIFGIEDGVDTITDTILPGEGNVIQFGEGITIDDLWLTYEDSTFSVGVGYYGAEMNWDGFDRTDALGAHAVDSFVFEDGTTVSYTELLDIGFDIWGTDEGETILGTNVDDRLYGFAGDDTLDAGTGDDELYGGEGNDTYLFNLGDGVDTIIDEALTDEGNTIHFGPGISLGDLKLSYQETALVITIGAGGDELRLEGFDREDALGAHAVDTFVFDDGSSVTYEELMSLGFDLDGTPDDDTLLGTNVDDRIQGLAGNDTIEAGSGNDLLDGGAGADTLIGGAGDDLYIIDDARDLVTENAGEGLDMVLSSVTHALGDNVENLTVTGTDAINATGNDLDNVLLGNSAANILDGGAGSDVMIGGHGDDTYVVDNAGDIVTENIGEGIDTVQSSISYTLGENVENLTLMGDAAINGTGNDLDNILTGNAADNILDGGSGSDSMVGGGGSDTYIVDNAGDIVTEGVDEGVDTARSSVSYALSENVENLVLTGDSAIAGLGNELDNELTGNTADNILDGGVGSDTMAGAAGDDTYIVDNAGDTVTENLDEGIDTVQSSVSHSLGANVENLTLMGSSAINATGNELDNVLMGNSGDNVLDGGAGSDAMTGGAGDDTYVVDNAGDTVTENTAEGIDTVESFISYMLTENVENLSLLGAAISGTGNALDNALLGNSADNVLDGGSGADALTGGAGDDLYIVDNTGDTIGENADEGIDTVQSSVSHALGANVENLTLTGDSAIDATGNDLNNTLTGNNAANILDGGSGADTMSGAAGDDTYIVDNASDTVVENAGEGIDSVESLVSFMLNDNVENLTLLGDAAINGTGNDLDNILLGNTAANVLEGGLGDDILQGAAGDDTLNGGAGADLLEGGQGNDTYLFNLGDGVDTIVDTALPGEGNMVRFGAGITLDDLTLTYEDTTLVISVGTGGDELRLSGFAPNDALGAHAVDTFVFEDGTTVSYVELINRGFDLVGTAKDDIIVGTNVDDRIQGLEGDDIITAGAGNDILDGGAGADTMSGGLGDDLYIVDNANDTVVEYANEGLDTVQTWVTLALAANVENLVLLGDAAINGTGNELNNVLTGNSANNSLDGQEGADTMSGEDGDDVYLVDNVGDMVIESSDAGIDTVQSSVTFTLSDNVENLTLTGAIDIDAIGNDLNNALIGNEANNELRGGAGDDALHGDDGDDTLVGGSGDDTLEGGDGDDTYGFNTGDGLDILNDTSGADMILFGMGIAFANVSVEVDDSGAHLRLLDDNGADTGEGFDMNVGSDGAPSIETVVFADGTSVDMANFLFNYVYGTNHTDIITTGERRDFIYAYNGMDIVSSGGNDDIVYGGGGTDLLFGESGNDELYGEGGLDMLFGGSGDDLLDGGDGIDIMTGDGGDDVYIVDHRWDQVVECRNGGTDTVYASVDYALPGSVENLTLTGVASIDGQGNSLDNTLIGNSAANRLYGEGGDDILIGLDGADRLYGDNGDDTLMGGTGDDRLYGDRGDDILDGGSGNDILDGAEGSDTYLFGLGSGQDVVEEHPTDRNSTDIVSIGAGVSEFQLWLTRDGSDLVLSIIGTEDKITISDWYRGYGHGYGFGFGFGHGRGHADGNGNADAPIEEFRTDEGKALLNNKVDLLVQAMAAFAPPVAGQTTLPDEYQTVLNPIIAASWS